MDEDWRAERLAALSAPDGWLNLTDRVEIGPGPQRVGRAAANDIVLSVGPDHLGVLDLAGDSAVLTTPDGTAHPFAATPGFPQLALAGLLLELHTVDGIPALRVRDTSRKPMIALDYFDYDPDWRIVADWRPLAKAQALTIGQKGAGETAVNVTHEAVFTREGRTVRLLPTHWKAGKPMFVIRDATSGGLTYAASRFLLGEVAGERIVLDFNRAHSPPCAFTDFAICPLPPAQNRLPFAIRAGELAP